MGVLKDLIGRMKSSSSSNLHDGIQYLLYEIRTQKTSPSEVSDVLYMRRCWRLIDANIRIHPVVDIQSKLKIDYYYISLHK